MIDREKVIKGLECCADGDCKGQECPYHHNLPEDWNKFDCNTELARDALELLKEQEPKQVVMTTNSYGTKFYHCPRCNHDIYAYPRQMYCSQCGQAVKWDD